MIGFPAGEYSQEALDLLDLMPFFGHRPNGYCYNTTASACAQAGRWQCLGLQVLTIELNQRGLKIGFNHKYLSNS